MFIFQAVCSTLILMEILSGSARLSCKLNRTVVNQTELFLTDVQIVSNCADCVCRLMQIVSKIIGTETMHQISIEIGLTPPHVVPNIK